MLAKLQKYKLLGSILLPWVYSELSRVGGDTNRGIRSGRCLHCPHEAKQCDNLECTRCHVVHAWHDYFEVTYRHLKGRRNKVWLFELADDAMRNMELC